MSSGPGAPLVLGRVKGARGASGEVTVRVVSGEADRWVTLRRVIVPDAAGTGASALRRVESARAYRDRLVLKLEGIDHAAEAATLRGRPVSVLAEDLPDLPADVHWTERLVGLRVSDTDLGDIGRVVDVLETGGVDLLEVRDDAGVETLIPLAKPHVLFVDEQAGAIRVKVPEGLRGLNSVRGRGPE